MTPRENPPRTDDELTELIVKASRQAVKRAIRMHIALDVPMVEWRDGEVCLVAPDDARLQAILTEDSSD